MNDQHNDINVLWLPGWYPSKVNFLPGDFTDRHATAVSDFVKVHVLFITKDPALQADKTFIEVERSGQKIVYRGYYGSPKGAGIVGKAWSVFMYYRLLFQLFIIAKKEVQKFDLAHVHISLRQGLFAQWLKRKHGLRYVITEQNSWFMPVGDQYFTRSATMRRIIRSNFKNAEAVHVVSNSLGQQLIARFSFLKTFTVIPNVVDSNLFHPLQSKPGSDSLNFFTITGDVYHKNTDGIIRAFANFIKQNGKAVLHIAGPGTEALEALAHDLAIASSVRFYGAINYEAVARLMQQADALIFFTRYETFGCVMAEALCCGTPVIASKIAVLEENLNENENALFVPAADEAALTEQLQSFVSKGHFFDAKKIAADARDKYNYDNIGRQFLHFYKKVLEQEEQKHIDI